MNSIALWYKERETSTVSSTESVDDVIEPSALDTTQSIEVEDRQESTESIEQTCNPISGEDKCPLTIHLNYWQVHKRLKKRLFISRKKEVSFLDAGIFLDKPNLVETVYIFIPFKSGSNHIQVEDLGKLLKERPELVYAIFNAKYKVSVSTGSKIINVTDESRSKNNFNIYVLDETTDIEYEEKFDGTLLKIKVPKNGVLQSEIPLYFRIRIKGPFVDTLRIVYRPKNRLFETGFSEIEVLDFRVQEIRNLNPTLLEEMSINRSFDLKKIHLLILRSAHDELMFHSGALHSSRILEKGLWKSYFSEDILLKDIFAYHMKAEKPAKGPLEDFIVGFKFKVERVSVKTILIYFAIALIIAYTVEMTAPTAKEYLSSFAGYIQQGWANIIQKLNNNLR